MNTGRSRPSEDEVVLAFSAEPFRDRATQERYLSDYPEYAAALIDCSLELLLAPARVEDTSPDLENIADQAWTRFQAGVEQLVSAPVANPFARLSPTAFKALAKRLNVNNLFLIRLRDCAVNASTIPPRFVQTLAAELEASAVSVLAYLRGPPVMVSVLNFRAAGKPAVTESMSFEEAVLSSQLTPDQQAGLRAFQD